MTSSKGRPLRLLMEVAEGRVASAILANGFLKHCVRMGASVNVLSPGAVYEPFVDEYRTEGANFTPLSFDTPVRGSGRAVGYERVLGRWLAHRGFRVARQSLWNIVGARLAAADAGEVARYVEDETPSVFLTTDVNMGFGRGLVGLCRRRGVPTVGNMFSWDHPFDEHPSRPDRLTCWSPMTKKALIHHGAFHPEQIEVIGAPAFDAYVDPQHEWTRERLCDELRLDPNRPIVVFATLGQMKKFWDETDSFRALLEEIDAGRIPGRPQVVLRMHPWSKSYCFAEFENRPDVVVSRYLRSSPGMRWWPARDEVVLAANLLRHANVCLSPGSTWAIEPSIFDTPTIVPVFNRFMPREYDRFFNQYWMSRHFRFLADRRLLPFPRSAAEMRDALCRALDDPAWMRDERRVIREELFGPLDGRATERLARVTCETATGPGAVGRRRTTGSDT